MQKISCLFLAAVIAVCSVKAQPVSSQERAELERKRKELQQEMGVVKQDLDKTKQDKRETLGTLTLIENKIDLKNRTIDNLSQELRFIDDDIYYSNIEIYRQRKEIDTLKAQYARSIVYAYKNRSSYDFLNFIFSATSFNDALKRLAYLRTYRAFRSQQAANIVKAKEALEQKLGILSTNKNKKSVVLKGQSDIVRELEDDKKEKDQVLARLKSRENELNAQLQRKKKQDLELKKQIAAIIRREVELAKKADAERRKREREEEERRRKALANASKPPANPTATPTSPGTGTPAPANNTNIAKRTNKPTREGNVLEPTPELAALSQSFEKNRGRLPWPVGNGFISMRYGPQTYMGNIKIDNPGVTIQTQVGTPVKSIFDGEVSSVSNIEDGFVVIIKHGKYFSSYSILSSVSVNKGDVVKVGQVIGKAGANEEGVGEVDLCMLVGERYVNPEVWISRR
jgi:septal ring factor EnvC (AmiA/AmiB activator)